MHLKKCCPVLSFKQHLFTLLRVGCTLYFIVYLFVRFSKFVTLKTRFLWRGEGGFYIFVLDMLLTSMLHALSPACDLDGNLWFFVHAYARTHFALPDLEQQQAVSALWTVPPQRPAGMFEPEALLSNTTTPTQVRLGTPRLSPALRFATSRSWLCVRARTDDSTGVTQPFPHIRISSTQSYSICMEIWAPQLESHKALSSTNSYYRFGLLPHKNPAIQAHRIFMVMPYNNSPKLWCIDLCYHYDNSHSHLTPHYTIETARGWI